MIDELKNIEYVLFDLDGTVSDSSEGITKSADKALKSEGIDVPFETLTSFIGPALRVSFGRYTDDVEKRDRMLDVYRESYSEKGWCENKLYPGLAELLRDLQKSGRRQTRASDLRPGQHRKPPVAQNRDDRRQKIRRRVRA